MPPARVRSEDKPTSEVGWAAEDLERRLVQVLEIAGRAVDRLAESGYTDPTEPGNSVRPEKLISETALLLYAASRAAHLPQVRERVEQVAKALIPYARSDRMLLGLCLEPALAWDYAQPHIVLRRLGHEDADFDELLRLSLGAQSHTGCERTPYQQLEQQWIAATWSDSASVSPRGVTRVEAKCVLGRSMDLLNGSRKDVYAFTHSLMYITGFRVCPRRLPRSRAVILFEAEAALARCLDEQDYDLAGEVLLAWPLTGGRWSTAAAFGFRVLLSVADEAGFLPASSTRLGRLAELQGEDRTHYLFATTYHTVYVMGLLCAALLRPGATQPSSVLADATVNGNADVILQHLDADGRSTHWREQFGRLNGKERDALAGLLLNIALRRKTSQRDFGGVHRLLELGYKLGLADTPMASQAAEMLERLSKFAAIAKARPTRSRDETARP